MGSNLGTEIREGERVIYSQGVDKSAIDLSPTRLFGNTESENRLLMIGTIRTDHDGWKVFMVGGIRPVLCFQAESRVLLINCTVSAVDAV